MMIAKAHHADAVREHLERQHVPIGFDRLASQLGILKPDLRAALNYLIGRGELIHERHRGYRYIPDLERELRRRAAIKRAQEVTK